MFESGKTLEEMTQSVSLARSTVSKYLEEWIAEERPDSVRAWVEDAVYRRIADAVSRIGDQYLRPIFDDLEESVDYDRIRIVIAHQKAIG